MNAIQTWSYNTNGTTYVQSYIITREQQLGFLLTEDLLKSLDGKGDVYTADFMLDYLVGNQEQILQEGELYMETTVNESVDAYMQRFEEGTPQYKLHQEQLLIVVQGFLEHDLKSTPTIGVEEVVYDPMPWDVPQEDFPDWMNDIGGYLFKNVHTGQTVFGSTFKACGKLTGANPRLLSLVYSGKRGHTQGWVRGDYSTCIPTHKGCNLTQRV